MKTLAMIAALVIGSASLAMAQSGPPGTGTNPAPNYGQSAAPPTGAASGPRVAHHATSKHHKKMYMSAKGMHQHKGSKLSPKANPQMKQ